MPNIKAIYWNIENFGSYSRRRDDYIPLCNFIAQVTINVDADILCIMEVKEYSMNRLGKLQRALINAHFAAGRRCEWYFDFVPGSINFNAAMAPYNPNNAGFSDQGRREGYAVFWKQNIDKFIMQRADPIVLANTQPPNQGPAGPGSVPNIQSSTVRARYVLAPLVGPLLADIVVPPGGAAQYTLPQGTNVAAPGISRAGVAIVPAGVTAASVPLLGGDTISNNTQIGPNGVRLTSLVHGVTPIVIPGGHTMSTALTLPLAGVTLVPQHVLSLVMTCRQYLPGGPAPYNPAGVNHWELGRFPATVGTLLWGGSRRPAVCTIKTNTPGPIAQQLMPIIFYHAPLSAPMVAMRRCSLSQQLFEAWTPGGAPGYAHNLRAVVGGDFNERLDPTAGCYTAFTDTFALNGAGCNDAGNQNIRANQPAPAFAPAFPPPGAHLTEADNPVNKSSVQLRHPVVGANLPVLSTDFDSYRRMAIDNIFYRGFTAAEAPRFEFRATLAGGVQQQFNADIYDLVRAVSETIPGGAVAAPMGAPPDNFFIPPAVLNQFANVLAFARFLNNLATPELDQVENPAELITDLITGVFQTPPGGDPQAGPGPYAGPAPLPADITPERRAAEFVKLFVSDHLPVIFEMVI